MTVEKLIQKLLKCKQDSEIFSSGLDKSFNSRSLTLITKVEPLNNYVVIVDGGKN